MITVRCYRCGKEFSVRENIRTDICPACMAFIDVARAISEQEKTIAQSRELPKPSEQNFEAAKPSAQSRELPKLSEQSFEAAKPSAQSLELSKSSAQNFEAAKPSAQSLELSKPSAQSFEAAKLFLRSAGEARQGGAMSEANVLASEREAHGGSVREGGQAFDAKQSDFMQAQKLLDRREWDEAAAAFERCLGRQESWQAHFGYVLAKTHDLQQLNQYGSLRSHVKAAFEGMPEQARLELGKQYIPRLEERRINLERSIAALNNAPQEQTEEERPVSRDKFGKIMVFLVLCAFAVGSIVLNYTNGRIGGIVTGVAAVSVLICIVVAAILLATGKKQRNEQVHRDRIARKSQTDAQLKDLTEQRDAVDSICGYLKF